MNENKNTAAGLTVGSLCLLWGIVTQCLTWAGVINLPFWAIWGPVLLDLAIVGVLLIIAFIAFVIAAILDR